MARFTLLSLHETEANHVVLILLKHSLCDRKNQSLIFTLVSSVQFLYVVLRFARVLLAGMTTEPLPCFKLFLASLAGEEVVLVVFFQLICILLSGGDLVEAMG